MVASLAIVFTLFGVILFQTSASGSTATMRTTPLPGAIVTQGFGENNHSGLDYDVTGVDPDHTDSVKAVANGRVIAIYDGCARQSGHANKDVNGNYTNTCGYNSACNCGTGFGNWVMVRHRLDDASGEFVYSTYSHLDDVFVAVDDCVQPLDPVGELGNTGASDGEHLHFELSTALWAFYGYDGTDADGLLDPVDYLGEQKVYEFCDGGGSGTTTTTTTTPPAAESQDAGPSIALTDNENLVAVNHTTRSGDNRTYVGPSSNVSLSPESTGISYTGWATGGSSDVSRDPTQDETVWIAALRETTSADAKLYVYEVENGSDIQRKKISIGSDDSSWSLDAPPSIVVDGGGYVYVAAVQSDGDMYVTKINPSGSPAYASVSTQIGNSAAWSTTGTVSLALGPDDTVWLAAVTKPSVNEVRTYRNSAHGHSFTSYGTVGVDGWTVDAAPAIVVDNDGDVMVVAVKDEPDDTGVMWSHYNDNATSGNWVKINDEVGNVAYEWSTIGSVNLATAANDDVYLTAVREQDSDGGEWHVMKMTPAGTISNSAWSGMTGSDGLGVDTDWSPHSAPDIAIIQGSGSIFVVGIKLDGNMYVFKYTSTWSPTQIASNGWSGNQD
jgi:hypothetical protein